jgi:hypothetical protein
VFTEQETAKKSSMSKPVQRKQNNSSSLALKDNRATSALQRKANQTGLPDNLKSGMENLSGMNLDHVKVHYNSSKPATVQAHAYAQGGDIHLASGQEKHLPHELGHVVQQMQGRVKPTKQLKSKTQINDDPALEKEADELGAKALQRQSYGASSKLGEGSTSDNNPIQCFSSAVIGEAHGENKIEVTRTTNLLGRSGFGWTVKVEPSKLAAALVERNHWNAPGSWRTLMKTSMEASGDFKSVMQNAESIASGNSPRWGAEDNLIGYGSHSEGGTQAPKDTRTHIEDPQVRNMAAFLRTIAKSSAQHNVTEAQVEALYPNGSGFAVLQHCGLNEASVLRYADATLKGVWNTEKTTGFLGRVATKPDSSHVLVPGPQGLEQVSAKQQWIRTTMSNINDGLGHILNQTLNRLIARLGAVMAAPIHTNPQSQQLITDIAAAKYHGGDRILGRMHAVAALARTLTQISGIRTQNQAYKGANPTKGYNGYIVGDSHLTDLQQITNIHNGADNLAATIGEINPIRRARYTSLRNDAKEAVKDAKRTGTLTVK